MVNESQESAGLVWSARKQHSAVTLADGSIILTGGNDGDLSFKNDVWRSTDKGATWSQVNVSAEWSRRAHHTSVALADGSIVLMGGYNESMYTGMDFKNDVWRSTDHGKTWVLMNASAGWIGRSGLASVVMPDGSIVVMGGYTPTIGYLSDVWRSTDKGATWTLMNASAEWGPRRGHSSVSIPDGSIVLMGGNPNPSDVWRSTDKGATWTLMNASAGCIFEEGHSSVALQDNSIVTMGKVWDGSVVSQVWQSTDYGTTWSLMTTNTEWSTRSDHSSVALPDGSIVLLGGCDYNTITPLNDVWRSTDRGATWSLMNAEKGWLGRADHSTVTLPDGSIVIMGGKINDAGMITSLMNDVWRSTDNGTTWVQMNSSAGWSKRWWQSGVALPDGSIVVMGGYDFLTELSDVWRSTDKGATWTLMTASAEWGPRRDQNCVALSDGSIILGPGFSTVDIWRSTDNGASWVLMNESPFGQAPSEGYSSVALPDDSIVVMGMDWSSGQLTSGVWRSTDKGATWSRMTENANWSARSYHSSVALPDNSIILSGGLEYDRQLLKNDIWRSTDYGAIWSQINGSAGWSPRKDHSSIALPDGSILVIGGNDGGYQSDVWRFTPVGSSVQNPSYTYTVPGTYQVALQAYNSDGYNSTRKSGYITVTDGGASVPVANFTATPTSGTVPLTVTFMDTSTGSPTTWNWSFGDGNTTNATVQNPVHTYTRAGTYTVSLNATNEVGSNTTIRINYIAVTDSKPIPEFSANLTKGTAPQAVSFTDRSLNNPTGWAWYFGDEDYTAPWYEMNASAGWSERQAHSSVVMPDGSIVLIGGINGGTTDAWRSTDYGATWIVVNESIEGVGRYGHSSVVMPDGSIIMMGGSGLNDVWKSGDNGATWTLVNASAEWSGREAMGTVVMQDGSIILMGGLNGYSLNDVWRSTDYGDTWSLVNASPGWSSRYGFSTVVLPDNSIVLMGGTSDYGPSNDVWRSTDYGTTWSLVNASAWWSGRENKVNTVVMPDGSIVLMGGNAGWLVNDVWRSVDRGSTWVQINASAGWSGRFDHTCVAMPDGSIVLMGGNDGSLKNDVWRFNPTGSSVQNPTHLYREPGTYQVSLQAYTVGGFNSTRKTHYINISEPILVNFRATPTYGIVPLTVTFNDTSIGSPTEWNWSFGDGEYSSLRNPVHTYTTVGTYTVSLNTSNAFGSNISTSEGFVRVIDGESISYVFQWAVPATVGVHPDKISSDSIGNIYVTDGWNQSIWKFSSDGTYLTKWGSNGTGNGQFNFTGGITVDGNGNVYVTDYGNHRVQKFTSDGTYLTQWGSFGTGNGQFLYPYGIAVDGSGNVYVADSGNDRIQKFTTDGIYVTQWGIQGSGNGQFAYPRGIAVDGNGNVYVLDTMNYRLQKFTSDGIYLTQWETSGPGYGVFCQSDDIAVDGEGNVFVVSYYLGVQKFTSDGTYVPEFDLVGIESGQFQHLHGIDVDGSGNIYVTDQWYNGYGAGVGKFTSDGTFVTQWGSFGTGNGQFYYPNGITVDGSGNVYVADTHNSRVQKFSSGGTYLTHWGSNGTANGQFYWPRGIAVDGNGNVYVADSGNHRVQKFTSEGTYVGQWGSYGTGNGQFMSPQGIAVDGNGNVYVADSGNHRVQKFTSDGTYVTQWGSFGTGNGQFGYPFGIAVDGSGNVYVADTGNNRIQKFTSEGTYITQWGEFGNGNGQFSFPLGIAVDGSGNVYVVGHNNCRFQKFTSDGAFISTLRSVGIENGQFLVPEGIAVDGNGNVYIADTGNSRIQKFAPEGNSGSSPVASFTANPTSGTAPLTVTFSDTSTGSPTKWNWTFGDGSLVNASVQNPVHTYLTAGTYTILLNATNAGGSNISTRTEYITVKKSDLPVPVISSVSPPVWYRNRTVTFSITGSNFQPGYTTVFFHDLASGRLTPNLTSVTSTRIEGTVWVPVNEVPGGWNVNVTTLNGGETMRKNAFTLGATPPLPAIASISPARGARNSTVNFTITGSNFQTGSGQTRVRIFEDVMDTEQPVTIIAVTPTTITGSIDIDANALPGTYIVEVFTVDGGTAVKTGAFAIGYSSMPSIATFTPSSGFRNDTVPYVITGTNFQPGLTTVTFRNQTTNTVLGTSEVADVTTTKITGTVSLPAAAPTGFYRADVITTDAGSASRYNAIRVEAVKPPVIGTLAPSTGAKGSVTAFTLTGSNFMAAEKTTVRVIDDVSGTELATDLFSVTPTKIIGSFTIPASAPSGKYRLTVSTTDGGATTKSEAFTVSYLQRPVIGSLVPSTGARNSNVAFTLTGDNFADGRTIVRMRTFGSTINATALSVNTTKITGEFPIPAGAVTGTYRLDVITMGGGFNSRMNAFTITA